MTEQENLEQAMWLIKTQKDRIAELETENKNLKEETKEFEVLYSNIKNGQVDMSVRGTTLKAISACFIQTFIQNGGTNFFLYDLKDDDNNKYSVTIQKETGKTPAESLQELEAENDKLRARLENAVELPAIVMIERTLVDGKFKHTQKAQAFNGRIGVVYSDKTRWGGLLVDICSERTFDYEPAKARLAEIKAEAKLKEVGGNN